MAWGAYAGTIVIFPFLTVATKAPCKVVVSHARNLPSSTLDWNEACGNGFWINTMPPNLGAVQEGAHPGHYTCIQ